MGNVGIWFLAVVGASALAIVLTDAFTMPPEWVQGVFFGCGYWAAQIVALATKE